VDNGLLDSSFYRSYNSNKDLRGMDEEVWMFFQYMVVAMKLYHLFNVDE
jgi:hypothetical protein